MFAPITDIIPGLMGATPESQTDHYSHPENIPFVTKILWEREDDFDPKAINTILGEKATPCQDETFGNGHRWRLGYISGMRTKLDFYPESRALSLTFLDSADSTVERMYIVDSIGLSYLGNRKGVAFLHERDMKSDIVLVQPLGNFDEFHRRFMEEKQAIPTLFTQRLVKPANPEAKWVSKRFNEMTYEDINSIFRVLSSKGSKDWRRQDYSALKTKAESVINRAIATIDVSQLNEDDLQILKYIKLRFIEHLSVDEVAVALNYTREHTTRKFRGESIQFLLEHLS